MNANSGRAFRRRSALAVVVVGVVAVVLCGCCPALPVMYHQNALRTGWNAWEETLSPAKVTPGTFGLIASTVIDDQVDTQPLVVPNQTIDGMGPRTVVYVASEGNTVYAIDGVSGAILKSANLGAPVQMPLGCNNNGPNVGINGTPVLDLQNQTLYAIAYVQTGASPQYQLHALDMKTLADKPGSPVVVVATHPLADGTIYAFNASVQRQRAALLLANGNVYAAFGSFCDFAVDQSRGWVLGWNAATLAALPANQVPNTLNTSPNSFFLTSIWMSGFGPAADNSGNIYFATGNSDYSGTTYTGSTNIQDSVVKVRPDLSAVVDLFTPSNVGALDGADLDYGSGGVLLLPDQAGPVPHVAVAPAKDGRMFILNRDSLGGFHNQDIPLNVPIGGCWCGPSYFEGHDGVGRVVSSGGNQVNLWRVNAGNPPSLTLEGTSPSLEPTAQDPGFFTTVSSALNGANTAIIWAVGRASGNDNHVTLYAFNGTPAAGTLNQLWSGVAGSWPNTGGGAFIVPTVSSGRVYVASYQRLAIFGLLFVPPLPKPPMLRWQDLFPVPPPPEKVDGAVFYGTVKELKPPVIVIALRDGSTLNVDLSEAKKRGTSIVPVVGRHVVVNGTVEGGILRARLVNRAKGPASWKADKPR